MEPLFSVFMFIRAYLRASPKEQNAKPARNELIQFADDHGLKIAAFDVENESGATLIRPQLIQLIQLMGDSQRMLSTHSINPEIKQFSR